MKLYEALRIDLNQVDCSLREIVESDQSLRDRSEIKEHVLRLIAAGGKRLRPMMVIVGSRFGQPELSWGTVMKTAALLEYVHTASLIHDDIIDRSGLRRGEPTLHARTNVTSAVLIANYMMARALEWASAAVEDDDDSEAEVGRIAEIASLVTELCLGEFGQLHDRFNFDLSMDAYLAKTRSKTALLMAHCLRSGADAAHADPVVCGKLFEFGEALGMAFQIRDDVLDFTGHAESIGKPAGADLRNGVITLPVLVALEDPDLAVRIRALSAMSSPSEMDEAIRLIQKSGAVERAMELGQSYMVQAVKLIGELSEYPASRDLQTLSRYFTQGE